MSLFIHRSYTLSNLAVDLYSDIFAYIVEMFPDGYYMATQLAGKLLAARNPLVFAAVRMSDNLEFVGKLRNNALLINQTQPGECPHVSIDEDSQYFINGSPALWLLERGDVVVIAALDELQFVIDEAKHLQENVIPTLLKALREQEKPYAFVRIVFAHPQEHEPPQALFVVPGKESDSLFAYDPADRLEIDETGVRLWGKSCVILYESVSLIVAYCIVR